MKACIIGVGRMGRRHAVAVRNAGFEIGGIYDVLPESVALAVSEQAIPQALVFASAREMLTTAKPDAVVIASTAPSHCEYVCLAAELGVRYILCEKPMAVSIAECDGMIEECRKSGAALAINHQMQFMEQYTSVKMLVDSPIFGGLRSVTVAASNFGLAMNGVHYFEMFRYLSGEEIVSISCWTDAEKVPNPRGPQYEDRSGQLRAVTPSGVRLYMEIGGDQGHGVHVVYGCRYGQIFVDELSGFMRLVHRQPEYVNLPTTRYGMPAVDEVRRIEPADVIAPTAAVWRAMVEERSYPDGVAGRHAVKALVAANLSGEQAGALIRLETDLPRDRAFPWA